MSGVQLAWGKIPPLLWLTLACTNAHDAQRWAFGALVGTTSNEALWGEFGRIMALEKVPICTIKGTRLIFRGFYSGFEK